ncbi:MAG: MinD/ParA family protein, partial [Mycobacterium sp.]
MTDRDDALRKDLGWTGPEESHFEPSPEQGQPAAPPTPPEPERAGGMFRPPPNRPAPARPD